MSQSRNSRHPLLAVAGLAAALSLGLTACGQGGQEPSETPAPTSSPASESASASPSASASSPAAPATETPTGSASPSASASNTATASAPASASANASSPAAAGEATVYWVSLAGSGHQGVEFPGCGDLLVESTVKAEDSGEVGSTERVEAGIEALLEDREYEHSDGLVNALYQSELTLEDVSLNGDTVTVDLSGQPLSSGSCDDPRIIAQLEYTAAANAGAYTAEVLVDGTPIQEFMSQKG
ncbi:MAG: GerMN domain-containing protein [Micrococcus sp.]|nr:GerMN domain-containing protein [Micrococcus sp.]